MAVRRPFRTSRAFLVRAASMGETDRRLTFFTEAAGAVTVVAKAAHRSRKRFGGALPEDFLLGAAWNDASGGRGRSSPRAGGADGRKTGPSGSLFPRGDSTAKPARGREALLFPSGRYVRGGPSRLRLLPLSDGSGFPNLVLRNYKRVYQNTWSGTWGSRSGASATLRPSENRKTPVFITIFIDSTIRGMICIRITFPPGGRFAIPGHRHRPPTVLGE